MVRLLIFILLFTVLSQVTAQDCPVNVTPSSQAQLESLMAQYPDCEHIPGNVQLRGGVTDLSPLSGIISIGGTLSMFNSTLSSFEGLSSLTSLGKLWILNNENITSLAGLEALEEIETELRLQGTTELQTLDGLNSLTGIGEDLTIWFNSGLKNVDGLERLEVVGGTIKIDNNPSVFSISGFSALQLVEGDLYINYCHSLVTIDGFNALQSVDGRIGIGADSALTSISGFEALTAAGGISIDNPFLDKVTGLNNVVDIGELGLVVWGSCDSLSLDNLETVMGRLDLQAAPLTNLTGCNKVKQVGGDLWLRTSMTNLPDFEELKSVAGRIVIDSRASLEVLDGFNKLESIGIGVSQWGFEIFEHDKLTEVTGFNSLETIEGSFAISENDILSSIAGFQNLFHVAGRFFISNNEMLTDCSPVCEFLLTRDKDLSTTITGNGGDINSPCWSEESLKEECSSRPIIVYDVDVNLESGEDRKRLLEGALIELSTDDELVETATTDQDGMARINYVDLDDEKLYQLDITHPDLDAELLVRHRLTREDLLNGFEIEFPFSVQQNIVTSLNGLDTIGVAVQLFGTTAFTKRIRGYDLTEIIELVEDEWSTISEDHDDVVESMKRVALGMHYLLAYYDASSPFSGNMVKVTYDMASNIGNLIAIFKADNGIKEKFTKFIDKEIDQGNATVDGIYLKAYNNLMNSIINQSFSIVKTTILDPFLSSFGDSPSEKQFVGMMTQLIFIIQNTVLKEKPELIDAAIEELLFNWLTVELVQRYYVDNATQGYISHIAIESEENQGLFTDAAVFAKEEYTETKQLNNEALERGELFESGASEFGALGGFLETFSVLLAAGSFGTLSGFAAPIYTASKGFKALAASLSGANFFNYGARLINLPTELGHIVSHISSDSKMQSGTYPPEFFEEQMEILNEKVEQLALYQDALGQSLRDREVRDISASYVLMHDYFEDDLNPFMGRVRGWMMAVSTSDDSLFREAYTDAANALHQYEMQRFVTQLQLLSFYMDTTILETADSIILEIEDWKELGTTTTEALGGMFETVGQTTHGPFVSVASFSIPDSLKDNHFDAHIYAENFGPETTEPFDIRFETNSNVEVKRWIGGAEVVGPYEDIVLGFGEQFEMQLSVHVDDPDSAITFIVDFEGVKSIDATLPLEFFNSGAKTSTGTHQTTRRNNDRTIFLYPNPASGEVFISNSTGKTINEVRFYSINGQEALLATPSLDKIPIDKLDPGLYVVELVMSGRIIRKPLVVH